MQGGLLVLLVTIPSIVASDIAIENRYKALGPGQNITGTILDKLTTVSTVECSRRLGFKYILVTQ